MSKTHDLLKSALELRYGQSLPGTDWAEEARLLIGVLAIPQVKLVPRAPTTAMLLTGQEHWPNSPSGLWGAWWDAA